MKFEVSEEIFHCMFWICVASIALGSVYMYHENKSPEVRFYIPAEHKQSADEMWKKIYNVMENANKQSPSKKATEAVQATYGIPFVVKNDKLAQPKEFVPPEIPEIAEPIEEIETVPTPEGFKDF